MAIKRVKSVFACSTHLEHALLCVILGDFCESFICLRDETKQNQREHKSKQLTSIYDNMCLVGDGVRVWRDCRKAAQARNL